MTVYTTLLVLLLLAPGVDPRDVTSQASVPTMSGVVSPIGPYSGPAQPSPGVAAIGFGRPAVTVPGQVSVLLDAAAYTEGNVLSVTVTNGLDDTIYADDEKTDCAIAVLERRTGSRWDPLLACGLERTPVALPIGPGRARTAEINPRSTNFGIAPGSATLGFGAGTYRVTFTYRLDPARGAHAPYSVSSSPFEILPSP